MRNSEVVKNFIDGKSGSGSNLDASYAMGRGLILCSYDEPIARLTENRLYVLAESVAGNYSVTTARHYSLLRFHLPADVVFVSREVLREDCGLPATAPKVKRSGHHTYRTNDGSKVRMGQEA